MEERHRGSSRIDLPLLAPGGLSRLLHGRIAVVPPGSPRLCQETEAIIGQCRTAVALGCCRQSGFAGGASVQPEWRAGKTEVLALEKARRCRSSGGGTDGTGRVRVFQSAVLMEDRAVPDSQRCNIGGRNVELKTTFVFLRRDLCPFDFIVLILFHLLSSKNDSRLFMIMNYL